jgi:hypothetical protein
MVDGVQAIFSGLFCGPRVEKTNSRVFEPNHHVVLLPVNRYALAPEGRRYSVFDQSRRWLHEVHDSQLRGGTSAHIRPGLSLSRLKKNK